MAPDEKELKKRIRNSFKNKISQAEITRRMQAKGYKVEYINELIKKSKPRAKTFYITTSIIIILILTTSTFAYLFFLQKGTKQDLANPLQNLKTTRLNSNSQKINETDIGAIEITPDFLSYLLNEIGAYNLHKNPFTREKPKISFDISGMKFNSIIAGEISTAEGTIEEPDIEFVTTREEVITAMVSDAPSEIFKKSIQTGTTQVNLIASQTELFAKGYLSIYNSLK